MKPCCCYSHTLTVCGSSFFLCYTSLLPFLFTLFYIHLFVLLCARIRFFRWVVLLIHEPRKQFDRVQMISDCAKLISKDESHIFSNPLIWRSRSLSVLDSAFIFQQFTTCLQHAAFQILSVIYVIQCRRRTSISNTITAKELAILFHETDQTRVYLVKIKIIL